MIFYWWYQLEGYGYLIHVSILTHSIYRVSGFSAIDFIGLYITHQIPIKRKKKGDTWNAMPSILTSKHKNAIPRAKGGLYSHHPFLWCLLCSQYWKPWKMVQCLNNLWKQRNLFSSYFEGIGSSNFVVVDLEAGLLSFTLFFQWKDFVLLSV